MKLALCNNDINECKKEKIYIYEYVYDDPKVVSIMDTSENLITILDLDDFEFNFEKLLKLKSAVNSISSILDGSSYHSYDEITGCRLLSTINAKEKYMMNYNNNLLYIEPRGVFINDKFICDSLIITIHSDSIKINGMSFVSELFENDIKDIAKTIKFICD